MAGLLARAGRAAHRSGPPAGKGSNFEVMFRAYAPTKAFLD
jgi:hypothetical protein